MKGTGPCGPSLNYFAVVCVIAKPLAQRPAGLGGWRIGEVQGEGKGELDRLLIITEKDGIRRRLRIASYSLQLHLRSLPAVVFDALIGEQPSF